MELTETKFKQTEIGLIPEDWDVFKLDELMNLLTDYDANGSFASLAENVNPVNEEGYAWYVRATDLENNTHVSRLRYVDESGYKFLRKTSLFGGELLFLKKGDVGRVYLFKMKTEYATVADNLYLLKLNNKSNSLYLYNFLKSKTGQTQIKSKVASSSIPALYKDDVKAILVPLPPTFEEQKAIAQVLSDTDKLLKSIAQKLTKKRGIKQGAMQRLFTPKEDWEVKKLGEIADFYKGKGLPKSEIIIEGKYKCIHYGELFTKYKEEIKNIISKTNNTVNCFYSKSNDVLMPTSDVTPNGLATASCLKEDDVILGGDVLVIRISKEIINGAFLSYFIAKNRKQVMQLVTGSTVYHLYGSDMSNFILSYPTVKEQTNIATIISDVEAEIAQLEQKLSKYKLLKQGLMQNLLTGKIRLV